MAQSKALENILDAIDNLANLIPREAYDNVGLEVVSIKADIEALHNDWQPIMSATASGAFERLSSRIRTGIEQGQHDPFDDIKIIHEALRNKVMTCPTCEGSETAFKIVVEDKRELEEEIKDLDRNYQASLRQIRQLTKTSELHNHLLKEMAFNATIVMGLIDKNGGKILPHLLDTDNNAGQRLRDLLASYSERKAGNV